jgi:hypothetical protein
MRFSTRRIFAVENRGLLLDFVVFIINVGLMMVLARLFANLVHTADTDIVARVSIILFCLGLAFLQPTAAILKRRQAHQRVPDLDRPRPRFLFHPFFYFLSKLVFLIGASGLLVELLFSKRDTSPSETISVCRHPFT